MKKEPPDVHCVYTEGEESLAQLLEASFLLYLARMLAASELWDTWPPENQDAL